MQKWRGVIAAVWHVPGARCECTALSRRHASPAVRCCVALQQVGSRYPRALLACHTVAVGLRQIQYFATHHRLCIGCCKHSTAAHELV